MSNLHSWDKNLPYLETQQKLLEGLKKFKVVDLSSAKKNLAYSLLYLQLSNGARIGESLRAIRVFLETGERSMKVVIGKQKQSKVAKDDYGNVIVDSITHKKVRVKKTEEDHKRDKTRPIRIPDVIPIELRQYKDSLQLTVFASQNLAHKKFGFNTHALRYCYINYLAGKNYTADVISKITGQSIETVSHYLEDKKGEKVLEEEIDILNRMNPSVGDTTMNSIGPAPVLEKAFVADAVSVAKAKLVVREEMVSNPIQSPIQNGQFLGKEIGLDNCSYCRHEKALHKKVMGCALCMCSIQNF